MIAAFGLANLIERLVSRAIQSEQQMIGLGPVAYCNHIRREYRYRLYIMSGKPTTMLSYQVSHPPPMWSPK